MASGVLRIPMPQGSLALYRRQLRRYTDRRRQPLDPLPVPPLDPSLDRRRDDPPEPQTSKLGGGFFNRPPMAGHGPGGRPQSPSYRQSPEAVDLFLEEATVRNLAATTIKKRRELLAGKLIPSARAPRGHRSWGGTGRCCALATTPHASESAPSSIPRRAAELRPELMSGGMA